MVCRNRAPDGSPACATASSAARLLLETGASVASVALDVGYESEAAFVRAFKRSVGRPAAAWRREREASLA